MTMEPEGGRAGLGEAAAPEPGRVIARKRGRAAVLNRPEPRPPAGEVPPDLTQAVKAGGSARDRAEARRLQVLAAAEECFRDHGFHSSTS